MMSFWLAASRAFAILPWTGGLLALYRRCQPASDSASAALLARTRHEMVAAGVEEIASRNTNMEWEIWGGSDKKSARACHELVLGGADEIGSPGKGSACVERDGPDSDPLFLFYPPSD